jgi:SAM-dependent methyltransferase
MRQYVDRLPRGARIVDGGCGLGEYVVYFHNRGFSTLGVDLSEKTISALRARFPAIGFVAGDIRALDLPSESVDAYLSWGVFEHFEAGPGACIAEARRVLKPDGLLFLTVPFDNVRHAVRGAFERVRSPLPGARFYQWRFTRAELARELTVGGFRVEYLQPISKREGLLRSLHFDFGMPFGWVATRALARMLHPAIPGGLIAHMLMAVARKPRVGEAGTRR